MNKPEVSLIAPCLNEQDNVRELTERFLFAASVQNVHVEIILIDDGSTDLTWQRIQELSLQFPEKVKSIRHLKNKGIPQSWITGVDASIGENCCLIDSDLQNQPEAVFDLLRSLREDHVQLVRGVRRPVKTNDKSRIFMSRFLNFLLNFFFAMSSGDNKSGFLLGHREVIQRIVHHSGHYHHYQTFIGVAAHSNGLITKEIDTTFENRRSGISFLSGKTYGVIKELLVDFPEAHREFGSRIKRKRTQ